MGSGAAGVEEGIGAAVGVVPLGVAPTVVVGAGVGAAVTVLEPAG